MEAMMTTGQNFGRGMALDTQHLKQLSTTATSYHVTATAATIAICRDRSSVTVN